jgi:hypothetical protein
MKILPKKIPALECPWYVKDWISKWSGIVCHDITLEQLAEARPDNFVVDEKYFIKNMEKIFDTIEQNGIKGMVIYSSHIYIFNESLLERLDQLSAGKNVHFISMSYKVNTFRNVIAHTCDDYEHALTHTFNYILSERLSSRRAPSHDFLFMVNTKNEFRSSLRLALEESGVLDNSIIGSHSDRDLNELRKKYDQLIFSIENQLPGNMCLDALKSWGPGVPNIPAYEKTFCEIVVESVNTNLDTTQDSAFSDLSEKTYRPIALNVPFVFLGSEEMYHKLINDGYQLVDDGVFYHKWHRASDLQTAVPDLVVFLKKIIADNNLRKNLESMAAHNHKNFWTTRKLAHQSDNLDTLKKCFGESPFDTIYDCLNF